MSTNGHYRAAARQTSGLLVGETAGMLGVAHRSVSRWFDAGLLTGWRLPWSGDRRVDPRSIVAFCQERGRAVPAELRDYLPRTARVLVCSPELDLQPHLGADWPVCWARTPFDAGLVAREIAPAVVVIDALFGEADARQMAATMREQCSWGASAKWLLVVSEDRFTVAAGEGFDVLLRRPIAPGDIAAAVRETGVTSGEKE